MGTPRYYRQPQDGFSDELFSYLSRHPTRGLGILTVDESVTVIQVFTLAERKPSTHQFLQSLQKDKTSKQILDAHILINN